MTAKRSATVRMNFTRRSVESAEAPAERYSTYYDEQVRGLGLVVHASGRRSFFWFRAVRGKPTWKPIADWPDYSVEQARATAGDWNARLARWKENKYSGPSPFETPTEELTLNKLMEEYISRHLRAHSKRPERAEKDLRQMVDFYLKDWKERKLGEVSPEDVNALHLRLGEKSGHRTANAVVERLRTMYNFGIAAKLWRGEIPTTGIKFYAKNERTRFLSPEELAKLWTALRSAPNPDLADFVNLALWTGARKGDIFSMRWQDVDLAGGNVWTIPDPKSRTPYVVPLDDEAVKILKARLKDRTEDCLWVFPGTGKTGHLTDLKKRWREALVAAGLDYPQEPGRRPVIHDLRRTQGSWQAAQGTSLLVIGKSLGHKSQAATQIYSRLDIEPVRAAMGAANKAMRVAMRKKPKAARPKLLKAARA